jgi:hypothetical protein
MGLTCHQALRDHNRENSAMMSQSQNAPVCVLMTEKGLAARWQVTVKMLQAHRWKGKGVSFLKIGRSVRYRPDDVLAYEAAHLADREVK